MKKTADVCENKTIHEDEVRLARENMPPENDIKGVSDLFKVLSDPTRMRIMWALDTGELCTCDIAQALNMTESAISHQLSTLKQAKLVKPRREGKNVYYSHDDEHVKSIVEIALEHLKHNHSH